jgi:hypothetical protein
MLSWIRIDILQDLKWSNTSNSYDDKKIVFDLPTDWRACRNQNDQLECNQELIALLIPIFAERF